MFKKKLLGRRIISLMLSLCMVTLNLPMFLQNSTAGAYTQPTSIAEGFETKDEVLAYNTAAEDASNQVFFGKDENGYERVWWIAGNNGGNLVLFSSDLLESDVTFYSGNDHEQSNLYKYNDGADYIEVGYGHYGASAIRETLNSMAENTNYFTTAEQALMKSTELSLDDNVNSKNYTVSDKLYAPYYLYDDPKILAENGSLPIIAGYYPESGAFWTNTPNIDEPEDSYVYVGDPEEEDGFASLEARDTAGIAAVTQIDATNLAFAAPLADMTQPDLISDDYTLELKFKDTSKNSSTLSIDSNTGIISMSGGDSLSRIVVMATGHDGNTYMNKSSDGAESFNIEQLATGLYHIEAWTEKTIDGVTYIGGSSDGANTLSFNYTVKGNQSNVKLKINNSNEPAVGYSFTYAENLTLTPSLENNNSEGEVTYTLLNENDTPMTNNVATVNSDNTISINSAGKFKIKATIAGDDLYNEATVTSKTITINRAKQAALQFENSGSIKATWSNVADENYVNVKFKGGSGTGSYTVGFSTNSCGAEISGEPIDAGNGWYSQKITFTSPGSTMIKLDKAKDSNYNAATQIKTTLTVSKAEQTDITFTGLQNNIKYKEGYYNFSAQGDPNVAADVKISTENGKEDVIKVEDLGNGTAKLETTGIGSCNIIAKKAGNNYYKDKNQKYLVTVGKGEQEKLTITNIQSEYTYSTEKIYAEATGGTGDGQITFTQVSGSEYGTVASDGTITLNKAGGSFKFKATRAGGDNYEDATSDEYEIKVNKAEQAPLTITNVEESYVVGTTQKIQAQATGGTGDGKVTFTQVSGSEYGTIASDGTITLKQAGGSFKFKATKAGGDNYEDVTSAVYTVQVVNYAQENPVIKVKGSDTYFISDGVYTFHKDSKIQLEVENLQENPKIDYSIEPAAGSEGVATVEGDTVTINKAGKFTVRAKINATANYAAAEVTKDIEIRKANIKDESGFKAVIDEPDIREYNGEKWTPSIKLTYNDITFNTDEYEITYPDDMVNVGKKTIKINLNNNNDYEGETSVTCEIIVDVSKFLNLDTDKKKEFDNVTNYVSTDGTTSAVVKPGDTTWVKEDSDNTYAWYGVEDVDGILPANAMLYVRWLSKEADGADFEKYYNQIDHKYITEVEKDRMYIFLVGVKYIDENGQVQEFNFKNLGKKLNLLIQLGEDWDKDDIQAVFIEDNANEIIESSYKNVEYPSGNGDFANLTLNHFSPYVVYDKLNVKTENDAASGNNSSEETESGSKGTGSSTGYVASGDTSYKAIAWLAGLALASGCTALVIGKKRRKDS